MDSGDGDEVKKEILTRENLEKFLGQVTEAALKYFDEGKTQVEIHMARSMANVTEPGDMYVRREAGRTVRLEITLIDPSDMRPEEWG